jgi:hypothetical protein
VRGVDDLRIFSRVGKPIGPSVSRSGTELTECTVGSAFPLDRAGEAHSRHRPDTQVDRGRSATLSSTNRSSLPRKWKIFRPSQVVLDDIIPASSDSE